MKSAWKIIKIILVFFASLFVISLLWYTIETAGVAGEGSKIPFIDYILYLIGYGELNIADHYFKTIFSTIGLFAVTLLSSVFTVNLFELRNKARLCHKMNIQGIAGNTYLSYTELKTFRKDIYHVNATLIAKIDDETAAEEQYIPFIPKKTVKSIKFNLIPGSVLYRYLRAVLKKNSEETTLLLMLVYTDIDNGQEYRLCQRFSNSDIQYLPIKELGPEGARKQVEDYIVNNSFEINLLKVLAINSEDIQIINGYTGEHVSLPGNMAFEAFVNMTSKQEYTPKDFVMACVKGFDDNWIKYIDLGCHFNFDYRITGDILVTMELKYGENGSRIYSEVLRSHSEFQHFSLDLSSKVLEREKLSHIQEICFTVFYEDVDPTTHVGSFVIKNCSLDVEA